MKHASSTFLTLICVVGIILSAGGADSDYVRVYQLIQDADALSATDQPQSALNKYIEAQTELLKLQGANPTWNERLVKFRLNYLRDKIGALRSQASSAPTRTTSEPRTEPKAPDVTHLEKQIAELREQNRLLAADRGLLEAKLREALSAQPAALDPRSLARAEEELKSLQMENESLRISLRQARSNKIDLAELEHANQALTTARDRIRQQEETIAGLTLEREALQNRVRALNERVPVLTSENELLKRQLAALQAEQRKTGQQVDVGLLEQTQKAVSAANEKLRQETERAQVFRHEKEALESRLKTMNDTLADLRRENDRLAKQLAAAKAKAGKRKPDEELAKRLQAANAELSSLRSANYSLSLEKTALENRLREVTSKQARHGAQALAETSTPLAAKTLPREQRAEEQRIKRLEREREELQKKLDAANKRLEARTKVKTTAPSEELKRRVESLQARLGVLEAKKLPYTPEELALLDKPKIRVVTLAASGSREPASDKKADASGSASEKSPPKTARRSLNDLPPGAGPLVAQAERDFGARRFAEAEAKYLQVLRMDETNPYTLANLAATQIEQDRLDAAEINLKKALESAPDDAFSLSLLGRLKVKQKKFDDAFEALSQSAKLNPQSAETQNYLGIVLSEKGLRGPAEAAFRKAIQLAPGYAVAHFNLAVAYATQDPPFLELARLHYRKALNGGHPKSEELERYLAGTRPGVQPTP